MSEDQVRLRRETKHASKQFNDAVAEYNAARSKLESTKESLAIALWRENNFLANGNILSDEQIAKLRYGL